MAGKESLDRASRAKNDEFYTQLTDVEAELRHYRDQFRGKVVLCNCDDPYESAFFQYFAVVHKHDTVADFTGETHLVRDHHHRRTLMG